MKITEIAEPNKYTKWYCSIILKALERPQDRKILKATIGYVESHHILPKSFQLGGEKDKNNLVFLTAKEHFIVHLCATKMFKSIFKNKMVFAFQQLRSSNPYQKNRYISSRFYEKLKPNFKSFVRLYKGLEIKYLYETQISEISHLEESGWSRKMTDERRQLTSERAPRGIIRSEETRAKQSLALKGKPRPATRGRKLSEAAKTKAAETRKKWIEENPELYQEYLNQISKRSREMHAQGIINLSGENNGMFGKNHSTESKERMSETRKQNWEIFKADDEKFALYLEERKRINRKTWESQELRDKCKIIRSKAYLQYGIHPQEFYEQKLRPLLQLGFLPTAIVKYQLLDMHAGSIKLWITRYGTGDDMNLFIRNKKNGAGANKAYIKFQEDQYKKHFFCGPPHPNDL